MNQDATVELRQLWRDQALSRDSLRDLGITAQMLGPLLNLPAAVADKLQNSERGRFQMWQRLSHEVDAARTSLIPLPSFDQAIRAQRLAGFLPQAARLRLVILGDELAPLYQETGQKDYQWLLQQGEGISDDTPFIADAPARDGQAALADWLRDKPFWLQRFLSPLTPDQPHPSPEGAAHFEKALAYVLSE